MRQRSYDLYPVVYSSKLSNVPITMENGYPELEPPCFTENIQKNSKRSTPQYIRELPWLIVSVQAVLLVAVLLCFFAYVLSRPYQAPSASSPTTTTVVWPNADDDSDSIIQNSATSNVFRKLPRFTTSSPPLTTHPPLQEIQVNLHRENSIDQIEIDSQTTAPIIEYPEPTPEPGYATAAIYTDHSTCSEIGNAILQQGGNGVSAAIASAVCLSAVHPHRGGLGGGLMMTIYDRNRCSSVNARETAPSAARSDYFAKRPDEAVVGAKASAVPGFLNGLYRAFERYPGNITFKKLLLPTVDICRRGIKVSTLLAAELVMYKSMIVNDPLMRLQFTNPITRSLLQEGDTMYCLSLADTLAEIADYEEPSDYFYRGDIGDHLIKEIKDQGGIMTSLDLDDYETEFSLSLSSTLPNGITLCGPPPPSIFPLVQLAISAMRESNSTHQEKEVLNIVWDETAMLGDPVFAPQVLSRINRWTNAEFSKRVRDEAVKAGFRPRIKHESADGGSSSVLVRDQNGLTVALTSSIGDLFGSRQMTRLGFFLNNAMGSFSMPISNTSMEPQIETLNVMQAGKGPISRMTPMIVIRNEKPYLASAGSDFISVSASLHHLLAFGIPATSDITPVLRITDSGKLQLENVEDSALFIGY